MSAVYGREGEWECRWCHRRFTPRYQKEGIGPVYCGLKCRDEGRAKREGMLKEAERAAKGRTMTPAQVCRFLRSIPENSPLPATDRARKLAARRERRAPERKAAAVADVLGGPTRLAEIASEMRLAYLAKLAAMRTEEEG